MQPSLREDYLETIQQFLEKNAIPLATKSWLQHLVNQSQSWVLIWKTLFPAGMSPFCPGVIMLTGQGRQTGERVIKNLETLQCFLSEILGIDTSSASDEACTLEHAISDETIDRLGQLIVKQDDLWHRKCGRQGGQRSNTQCTVEDYGCQYPSISDCAEGENVIIHCIHGRACTKRLLDLGMIPGERASVKRKLSNDALVVQVKECDAAFDHHQYRTRASPVFWLDRCLPEGGYPNNRHPAQTT